MQSVVVRKLFQRLNSIQSLKCNPWSNIVKNYLNSQKAANLKHSKVGTLRAINFVGKFQSM